MKKKLISIASVVFMLVAFCVPSVGLAALTPASPEIFDFEDQTAGTAITGGNGWTLTLGTGTHRVEYVQDPLDSENQVLDTYCAAAKQDTNVTYTYSSYTSGKAVFDFNYMITRSVGNDANFRLISSKTEKFAVDCQSGSWKYRIGGGSWVTVPDKTAVINTWYHITIALNPNTEKISFWLDGEPVLQDADSGIDITNINKFQIYNRCTAVSNYKSVYFDNIRCRYYGTEANAEPIFNLMNSKKTIDLGDTLTFDFTGRVIDTDGNSVTLTSDAGTMDGNILRYTPDSAGTKTIHITADDGTEQSVYTMTVNVLEKANLTVSSTGNGTVSPSGTTTLIKGTVQTITATPEDGWMVKSVKINGSDAPALQSFSVTVDADTTVEVTFAEIPATEPTIAQTYGTPFTSKDDVTINGNTISGPKGILFAKVADITGYTLEDYGMEFALTQTDLTDGKGIEYSALVKKSTLGNYGICFCGSFAPDTEYYARPYATYKKIEDETTIKVVGDVISFTPNTAI